MRYFVITKNCTNFILTLKNKHIKRLIHIYFNNFSNFKILTVVSSSIFNPKIQVFLTSLHESKQT